MRIFIKKVGDVAVVKPNGSLDANNALDFNLAMDPLVGEESKILLDLSMMQFLDSYGLQSIISCLRQLNANGGDLKLCNATKRVDLTLRLVRMDRLLDICETVQDGLEAFAREST